MKIERVLVPITIIIICQQIMSVYGLVFMTLFLIIMEFTNNNIIHNSIIIVHKL